MMNNDQDAFLSASYLIVGAGVFGLSTARELLSQGAQNVVVIDKSPTLPAPDGSSTDINRIVRSSYSDPLYTSLAREAIELWKKDFPGIYRESGVLVLGNSGYCRLARENDKASGATITSVPDRPALVSLFPADVPLGEFLDANSVTHDNEVGYLNHSGGWADARAGIAELMRKVQSLGGDIRPGVALEKIELEKNGSKQRTRVMVRKSNSNNTGHEVIETDIVVVATGAWTPSLFPQPDLGVATRVTAVGQSVASVQLSEEESERYKSVPVVLNFDTGFYVFPPNEDRLLKVAIHDGGYANPTESVIMQDVKISTPRTVNTHGHEGLKIPADMARKLRVGLKNVYPALVNRPFETTRLCWYTDTKDGDWIIDRHPEYSNIVFATGGSGHAYKFLPVLGRLVVQRIRGYLDPKASLKFAFKRNFDPEQYPDRLNRQTAILSESRLSDGRDIIEWE